MFPRLLAPDLVDRIRVWGRLKRWERREIGQTLRRMGLSYKEISAVIPVPKGTLSTWCRDLDVPNANRARIGTSSAVGALLRDRALEAAAAVRQRARVEASVHLDDPHWVAGVVAYWAEGSKRNKGLRFSNSDPELIKLFISWAARYLDVQADQLTVQLHLHSGQDQDERKRFWSNVTNIPLTNFIKTYVKPEGTGHRKNVLYNGTATIRVQRSTVLLQKVLGWIDAVAETYADLR